MAYQNTFELLRRHNDSLVSHTAISIPGLIGDIVLGSTHAAFRLGELTLKTLGATAKAAVYVGALVPAAAGLTAGAVASKATGPSKEDLKAIEQRLVNAKIKTMLGENLRHIQADIKNREGKEV